MTVPRVAPAGRVPLRARLCLAGYTMIGVGFAIYLFLGPGMLLARDLADTTADSAIPPAAWRLSRALAPRFEAWARARLGSGRAENLSTTDISGTEWPLFGAVFYLWSVEALQQAWECDQSLAAVAPAVQARRAVDAAAALVADPGQAGWVKKHWGRRYLEEEDVFYRFLVISAFTTHARLTGSSNHLAALRGQVESLSGALAQSKSGLLDDYPGQCFPTDVIAATAAIRDADAVLGTDHAAFVTRERRAFEGPGLDAFGLVPYQSDSSSGRPIGSSRGVGNSYALLHAPLLWPDLAEDWYRRYQQSFRQERWGAVGFREFAREASGGDWYFDVDSGPVLAGHGVGFGLRRRSGADQWSFRRCLSAHPRDARDELAAPGRHAPRAAAAVQCP